MNRKNKDFSNKTVVVMLIVVIIVSAVCLGTYMNVLGEVKEQTDNQNKGFISQEGDSGKAQGVASLKIIKRPE